MSDIGAHIETDGTAPDILSEAAQWAVRAQSGDMDETGIIALTDWLDRSSLHADAYRDALSLWASIDTKPAPAAVSGRVTITVARPALTRRTGLMALIGGGMAAAVAIGLIGVSGLLSPTETYQTQKGERRTVALADGTQLMLNTDTRLSVRLGGAERTVTLERGEAAIIVAHDDAHPFHVRAGNLTLTDIGTEFNVSRLNGRIGVSVREGVVDMTDAKGTARLRAGDFGQYQETSGARQVSRLDPSETFAWQTSRAIYRNQPLSVVVSDLNRYFDKPIIVEGDAGQLRLTAIMTLDSQTAVAGRLTEFLPVDARTTSDAIYLRSRAPGA